MRMLSTGLRPLDTRRVKPAPKRADPFYLSVEWRSLVRHLLKQRGKQCQDCGRTDTRIFADHIVELKDGGAPLDPNNVQLRCGKCHTLKTNREKAKRSP